MVPLPLSPEIGGKRAERIGGLSPVRTALERLQVTSIDRLTREARAIDPRTTRASVTSELSRLPVKVFGGTIVALVAEEPSP